MDWILFFGRFHPLILHLPIGALATIAVVEFWNAVSPNRERSGLSPGFFVVLYSFATATALASIATGLMLSQESGYEGETLDLHKWLSISVGVACVMCTVLAVRVARSAGMRQRRRSNIRFGGLCVTLVLISLAGHQGGNLTHGEDFLTEHAPEPIKQWTTGERAVADGPIADATVYEAVIHPILETNCLSCHGESKRKGGLAMDTRERLLAGGDSGVAFVSGDPVGSLMLEQISLPLDHDDHMPPKGKRQPSEEQVEALRWWIAEGADFERRLSHSSVPAPIRELADASTTAIVDTDTDTEEGLPVPNLDSIQALRTRHITIQRLYQGANALLVDFAAIAREVDDATVGELLPLAENVVWLNLSRCEVSDESLAVIARMPNLETLNLSRTPVSDDGLGLISGLLKLKSLNLSDTAITDQTLNALSGFPALQSLHVNETNVTPEGVQMLRDSRPDLEITFVQARADPRLAN